ncbi:MAG: thioesterase family protein [Myxococcota bacterium]
MALEYRYLLRLVSIADNRHGELMEFFLIVEPRSGRNKWQAVFDQVEAGEQPIVHRNNNILEAQRMARSIYRSGGIVAIEDLAPEPDEEEEGNEAQVSGALGSASPGMTTTEEPTTLGGPDSPKPAVSALATARRPKASPSKPPPSKPTPPTPAPSEPALSAPEPEAMLEGAQAQAVVHHQHVNAQGRVAPYALARMLEDLRYSAITKDTLGMRSLFSDGSLMVLRAQEIQILEPLNIGDALLMDLRIIGSGRTSIKLGHRVWRASDNALVARVTVSGVHLGEERQPTPLPDAFADLVTPDPELADPQRLDEAPPRRAWKLSLDVRPSDLDLLQHVNHGHTLRMLDDARLLAVHEGAFSKEMGDLGGPLSRCVINYEREMLLGDALTVQVWADEPGVVHAEIRRKRTVTARGLFEIAT